MGSTPMMTMNIDETPVEERAGRYREMAKHTQAMAEHVGTSALKQAYLDLSDRWSALADSAERKVAPEPRSLRDHGEDAI